MHCSWDNNLNMILKEVLRGGLLNDAFELYRIEGNNSKT